MERVRAALGGVAVAVLILGGFVAVRWLVRLVYALLWLGELLVMAAFALLIGYLAYRVFWGVSDDPRRH